MNQILTTKPVRPKKVVKVKVVKTFFAVSLLIFGICMVSSGSYAMYKNGAFKTSKSQEVNKKQKPDENQNSQDIQIHLSSEGAVLHAQIIGTNSEIAFVTYKWDDEEEKTVELNKISGNIDINIPSGEHSINITAVDTDNKSKNITKKVRGVTKPNLQVVQDGSQFLITASDEIGLDRLEFILNGQGYLVRVEGEKEKEFRYDLEPGDNTLEVKAYNVEGVTEEFKAICHN